MAGGSSRAILPSRTYWGTSTIRPMTAATRKVHRAKAVEAVTAGVHRGRGHGTPAEATGGDLRESTGSRRRLDSAAPRAYAGRDRGPRTTRPAPSGDDEDRMPSYTLTDAP